MEVGRCLAKSCPESSHPPTPIPNSLRDPPGQPKGVQVWKHTTNSRQKEQALSEVLVLNMGCMDHPPTESPSLGPREYGLENKKVLKQPGWG